MSDEIPSPVAEAPALAPAPASAPAASSSLAERLGRHERWIVPVAAAAVALAVGASGTVGGLLAFGWRPPVDRQFFVSVILKQEITDAQKATVRSALGKLDGVQLETSAEAYADFQKLWGDKPNKPTGITADSMPETFKATKVAHSFDCSLVSGVGGLPGVYSYTVVMRYTKKLPGATIGC